MNEILKQFPPSSTNNSREIVRGKLERMKKFPSEKLAQDIEKLTGIDVDWNDQDADFMRRE